MEIIAYLLQFKDQKSGKDFNIQERYLMEKVYPAVCKLITYLCGYLLQDHTASEGAAELKAGLRLVMKAFTSAVTPPGEPLLNP